MRYCLGLLLWQCVWWFLASQLLKSRSSQTVARWVMMMSNVLSPSLSIHFYESFNILLYKRLFSCSQEKRIARVPYQWYLMERDRRVSGTGVHYESKVKKILCKTYQYWQYAHKSWWFNILLCLFHRDLKISNEEPSNNNWNVHFVQASIKMLSLSY